MVDPTLEHTLTDEASKAIMEAHFIEARQKCTPIMLEAVFANKKDAWKRGAEAHYQLAKEFAKEGDARGMIYFFSAANCALNGGFTDLAEQIFIDLDACHFTYNGAQQNEYNSTYLKLKQLQLHL